MDSRSNDAALKEGWSETNHIVNGVNRPTPKAEATHQCKVEEQKKPSLDYRNPLGLWKLPALPPTQKADKIRKRSLQ
jgi:hypothetical protein